MRIFCPRNPSAFVCRWLDAGSLNALGTQTHTTIRYVPMTIPFHTFCTDSIRSVTITIPFVCRRFRRTQCPRRDQDTLSYHGQKTHNSSHNVITHSHAFFADNETFRCLSADGSMPAESSALTSESHNTHTSSPYTYTLKHTS